MFLAWSHEICGFVLTIEEGKKAEENVSLEFER
jgi:hypothetical protein